MPVRTELFPDVAAFAKEMMRSQDIDPIYAVLAKLYQAEIEGIESQLWFTALYLAYYNITSALAAFRLHPYPEQLSEECGAFPCSTERRNLRGGKVGQNVQSYLEVFFNNSPASVRRQWSRTKRGWAFTGASNGNQSVANSNYEIFWTLAQEVWGNGRWAAFKWAEILKKVHGFNLAAPDMRMQFCSGPKEGLEYLYDCPGASVEQLNKHGADMMMRLQSLGVDCGDWETLETVCCNFNSLRKGKYYIGHDIDEMQGQIEHSSLSHADKALLYQCRMEALPREYLGEYNFWLGVRKGRMKEYKDNGKILREHPSSRET